MKCIISINIIKKTIIINKIQNRIIFVLLFMYYLFTQENVTTLSVTDTHTHIHTVRSINIGTSTQF